MKKAIVVGASSGIGRELARLLAEEGYTVGITGRRKDLLEELKKDSSENIIVKAFDINDHPLALKMLNELVIELGGMDLLIFSSGTGEINKELDFNIEKETINTNVLAWTAIIGWAFNCFIQQKLGHLVAITSIGGLRGNPNAPAYNATKAFQINYLEGLRMSVHKKGYKIYITDIRPGLVDTAMAKGDGLFWVMPVTKASKQIYNAIKSKKSVAYITKRWGIIAFLMKILPRSILCKT